MRHRFDRMFLLLILLLGAVPVRAAELLFQVEHAAGLDMDADKLAALLASSDVEVRITYAPVVAVPGWTGRVGLCGISGLRDVCIKKRWRSLFLRGDRITRTRAGLRFRVPGWHWFGPMPYRPAGPVRVSLPAVWPGALPVNIDTTLERLGAPPERLLTDMHLPPPYTGLASWSWWTGNNNAVIAWRTEACHPGVFVGADVQPRMRGHRQAEAYVEWMRALADSDWWAAQIPDVRREQGESAAVTWRRVQVARAGVALRLLRVEQPRLLSSSCPGHSREEFTWLNDRLLAVVRSETPDIFSDDAICAAQSPRLSEALWWQGELQRHTQGVMTHELWRGWDEGCASARQSEPETMMLREQAERWWQQLTPAQGL